MLFAKEVGLISFIHFEYFENNMQTDNQLMYAIMKNVASTFNIDVMSKEFASKIANNQMNLQIPTLNKLMTKKFDKNLQ